MKIKSMITLLALAAGLAGSLSASTILQWGFDSTSGPVATPVNDDSGANHHGTNLLWGAAPTYSADIPAASNRQFTTGVGSVDFSSTNAAISTAASASVGSGQGIVSSADIFNAGGLTLEVWVKNPSAGVADNCFALNIGGYASLGINNGSLGFFGHTSTNVSALRTNAFTAGEWNHLAAVLSGPNSTATSYSTISLYLNGELVNSVSNVNFHGFLTRAASVGNHQFGDFGNFNGLVYEPRVSTGALAPSQFTYIPEPGGMTLLALGGMSLLVRRRRHG